MRTHSLEVRTSGFQRPENQEVFPVPFPAVTASSICHSTPKISVQHLQKWTVVPVFSLNWHCSMSFLSAWLLNAVHFFAHYFILFLPCNSLEWKWSSQQLPDESQARLRWCIPVCVCSVPPAACSSHTPAAMKCWKQAGQPKHSPVFAFCHLLVLPLVSVPSLGHGPAQELIAWTHPEWAIPYIDVFTLPLASEYPEIYRWKTEEKSINFKISRMPKEITVIRSQCSLHQIPREKATS